MIGRARIDGVAVVVAAEGPTPLPLGATGFGAIDASGAPGLVVVLPPGVAAIVGGHTHVAVARLGHGQRGRLTGADTSIDIEFRAVAVARAAGELGRRRCDLCRSHLAPADPVRACPACATVSCDACASTGQCLALDCGAAHDEEAA